MSTWVRVFPLFGEPQHADPRYVPVFVATDPIADAILAECEREVAQAKKRLEPYTRRPETKHWLDLGGIAQVDRKLFNIELSGLKLTVPAKDVEAYLDMATLKMGRKQLQDGSVIHRVPVHPVDLWLSPIHLDLLRERLLKIVPEAIVFASVENEAHNAQIGAHPNVLRTPRPVRKDGGRA